METLHKREWESRLPLADWEARWQISLSLSPLVFHLVLFPPLNAASAACVKTLELKLSPHATC